MSGPNPRPDMPSQHLRGRRGAGVGGVRPGHRYLVSTHNVNKCRTTFEFLQVSTTSKQAPTISTAAHRTRRTGIYVLSGPWHYSCTPVIVLTTFECVRVRLLHPSTFEVLTAAARVHLVCSFHSDVVIMSEHHQSRGRHNLLALVVFRPDTVFGPDTVLRRWR